MSTTLPPIPARPRARALTLALGLPFVLVAIVWGALGVVSLAGQDSYHIPLTPLAGSGELRAHVGSGDVTIAPSNDGRTRYQAEVHYSLFRPNLHWRTSGDRVVLAGQPLCIGWGNCGVNLQLSVPRHRAVDAGSASGQVQVRDLAAPVMVRSDSGDIIASRLSGSLQLFDSSGEITATRLTSSRVLAKVASGDVNLSFAKPPAHVQVHDASGEITVAVPGNVSYFIDAKTSSGTTNIGVPQNPHAHRTIYLRTASGDINVVPSPVG